MEHEDPRAVLKHLHEKYGDEIGSQPYFTVLHALMSTFGFKGHSRPHEAIADAVSAQLCSLLFACEQALTTIVLASDSRTAHVDEDLWPQLNDTAPERLAEAVRELLTMQPRSVQQEREALSKIAGDIDDAMQAVMAALGDEVLIDALVDRDTNGKNTPRRERQWHEELLMRLEERDPEWTQKWTADVARKLEANRAEEGGRS